MPSIITAAAPGTEQEYLDAVASLIMCCPNLERLLGFHQPYTHNHSRLVDALAKRWHLKEHVWIIGPMGTDLEYRRSSSLEDAAPYEAQDSLHPELAIDFLGHHDRWWDLTTLFLHCMPGGTLGPSLISRVLRRLPSLKNLYVSSFSACAFDDSTLLYLPVLHTLRLEALPGITSAGLSRYATSPTSSALKSLSLISLSLSSLPILARLLSNLYSLTHLTLLQTTSPILPPGEVVFLQPYLASSTLEFLHWDILKPLPSTTTILAASISAGGFPALRTIRAPVDPDGILQAICRPRATIELRSDKYRFTSTETSAAHKRVSAGTANNTRSLYAARKAAQARIDAAKAGPSVISIRVEDEGVETARYELTGFVGAVGSAVKYVLEPDIEGSDEAIVTMKDLLREGEMVGGEGFKDGCVGAWNERVGGKKGVAHAQRARWQEVGLGQFMWVDRRLVG